MRPSKRFFFRALGRYLKSRRYEVALDAASADFRNLAELPASMYIGLDLDASLLQKGLATHPGALGVQADIRSTASVFPENSVGLCVSTHTLSHIPARDYASALHALITVNRQDGDLIFNIACQYLPELLSKVDLTKSYRSVTVVRYRNVVSRALERSCETASGEFQPRGIVGLLARSPAPLAMEYITTLAGAGDQALVFCTGKKAGVNNPFQVCNVRQAGDRLYRSVQLT